MFRHLCYEKRYDPGPNRCTTHPHNAFIQALTETGIIGFLVILSIFSITFYLTLQHLFISLFNMKIKISDSSFFIIFGIFLNLLPIVPSGNIFGNWLSVIYYLPVPFLLFRSKFFVKTSDANNIN